MDHCEKYERYVKLLCHLQDETSLYLAEQVFVWQKVLRPIISLEGLGAQRVCEISPIHVAGVRSAVPL
jgi:hypothetical protein